MTTRPMPTLTLHQPWASLIALGYKTCETRSWKPPRHIIGERIAIHAGRFMPELLPETIDDVLTERVGPLWRGSLPRGAVVATAELWFAGKVVGYGPCVAHIQSAHRTAEVPLDEYGDFSLGRWLWLLRDVEALWPPHQTRGHQGVWYWDAPGTGR